MSIEHGMHGCMFFEIIYRFHVFICELVIVIIHVCTVLMLKRNHWCTGSCIRHIDLYYIYVDLQLNIDNKINTSSYICNMVELRTNFFFNQRDTYSFPIVIIFLFYIQKTAAYSVKYKENVWIIFIGNGGFTGISLREFD